MDIFVYLFLVSTYIFLFILFFRKNVASFYHISEKINIILTVDDGRDTCLRFSNIHFFHPLHILSDLILGIHPPPPCNRVSDILFLLFFSWGPLIHCFMIVQELPERYCLFIINDRRSFVICL